MAGETRDGFGWEYYVGKYDGLGRRRRRWVRELRRISSGSNVLLNKSSGKQKKKTIQQQQQKKARPKTQVARSHDTTNILQTIQQQYNFKGFGWSFYKSLLFMRSFGTAIRVPLSSNLDFYDQHTAWPYISTSTYFGYPWVIATFLNASMPLEAIKYIIGGAVWKVQWSLAVFSAVIRSIVEAPWRLSVGTLQTITALAGRTDYEKQDKKIADSLISIIHENKETSESIDSTDIKMENFIELSNATDENSAKDMPTSANTVMESPRGGAAPKSSRKKTIFGNEIPTFHRPYSIEYSSTIQQRVGICVSYRVSKERGYEYRCNFFFTSLPTILFWQQLDEERNRRIRKMQQLTAKLFGSDESTKKSASASSKADVAKRSSKNSAVSSFLNDHSSSVGFSTGWPLPVDPFFSFNLLVSLSGFYYGWLLKKCIGSLISVGESPGSSKSKKSTSTTSTKVEKSEISDEELDDLVSSSDTIPLESEVRDSEEKKKRPVESK